MNPNINNNKEVLAFYNSVKSRLENGDIIQNAITLAYNDLKRTIHGFSKCEKKEQIKNQVATFLKRSYEELIRISDTYKKYNDWHEYVCKRIVAIFIEGITPINSTLILSVKPTTGLIQAPKVSFTIGQAQKWVNMFMKYMYLCDERMEKLLPLLHIPIDNVILDGIENHSSYFPLKKCIHGCRPWSRLDDYKTYLEFQERFREIFRSPLLHEFRLWNKWNSQNYKQFEELTEFIDYFSNMQQDFYPIPLPAVTIEEFEPTGKKAKITKFTYPQYATKFQSFLQIIKRYHVDNFIEILSKKELENIEYIEFEAQDAFTILALFAYIKYILHTGNESVFGYLASKGIIYKMLLRLQNIDNNV